MASNSILKKIEFKKKWELLVKFLFVTSKLKIYARASQSGPVSVRIQSGFQIYEFQLHSDIIKV